MKTPNETPVRLTEAQRRHLEFSLGHVVSEMEEAACWFERWPLPDGAQEATLDAFAGMRSRILTMAEGLGLSLPPLRPDPLRRLDSLSSSWWSTVLDCRSRVLRGYGRLDPEAERRLDPIIEELAAAILELGSRARKGP